MQSMKHIVSFTLAVLLPVAAAIVSCNSFRGPEMIFDTDMGNDVDDALALDMLYKYMDAGKIDLAAITLSKEGPAAPEFLDVMGTWYGYPDIPTGIIRDGADCGTDSLCYTRKVLDMKSPDGSPLFGRSRSCYEDLPESVDLYRQILASVADKSVTVVSVGFFTNLARLLESGPDRYSRLTGRELVDKKVGTLYVMAGNVADTTYAEYNIVKDIPSAVKVFAGWPGPIVISPFELGAGIKYPSSSIENDFAWAGSHPVVAAYRSFLKMPYDRETWDLTAVLAAVEKEDFDEYFTLSPEGTVTVTDSGTMIFKEGKGNRRYLSVTPGQKEKIKAKFISLVTSPPESKKTERLHTLSE